MKILSGTEDLDTAFLCGEKELLDEERFKIVLEFDSTSPPLFRRHQFYFDNP